LLPVLGSGVGAIVVTNGVTWVVEAEALGDFDGATKGDRLGTMRGDLDGAATGVAEMHGDWLGAARGARAAALVWTLAGVLTAVSNGRFGRLGRLMFTPPLCVMAGAADGVLDGLAEGGLLGFALGVSHDTVEVAEATLPKAYAAIPKAVSAPMLSAMTAVLIFITLPVPATTESVEACAVREPWA
jgi:hypothetical protein